MYCRNCNKEIPDNTQFCPYCGIPQSAPAEVPQSADESATVLVSDNNAVYPNYPNPGYQQPVNPGYQQPVNPGYQPPVTPDFSQGQDAGFQPPFPPVNPAYQQPAPAKKSKTGLIIGLVVGGIVLVGIIAVVLGVIFSSSDSSSDYDNYIDYEYDDEFENVLDDYLDDSGDSAVDSYDDAYADSDEVSAEFQKILDDNALEFTPADFGVLDYVAYGSEDADGMIDIHEFGCDGDNIDEWMETICYPITGYSQDEIDALGNSMMDAFSAYESLDFCLVDYYQLDDFYVIEIYLYDLDQVENIEKLQELGMVESGLVFYISLSQTETDLISQGYVKR